MRRLNTLSNPPIINPPKMNTMLRPAPGIGYESYSYVDYDSDYSDIIGSDSPETYTDRHYYSSKSYSDIITY